MDGRFLDEHGLPDGNLYKMESGTGGGESNNQGPTQPSDSSDLVSFVNGYSGSPTESWWRSNLDLQGYYGFRAISEAIHNGDIGYGKNYFYYHDPDTNRWSVFPWDLDLTWAETMYGNGNDPLKARLLYTNKNYSGTHEPFITEYRNRLREIMDLLFNSEQVGRMIDEYAGLVNSPDPGASMVDADRAMWDYNPILSSSYVNSSKAGVGRFYQSAATKDFPGMAQQMKDYVAYVYTHTRNWYERSLERPQPDEPGRRRPDSRQAHDHLRGTGRLPGGPPELPQLGLQRRRLLRRDEMAYRGDLQTNGTALRSEQPEEVRDAGRVGESGDSRRSPAISGFRPPPSSPATCIACAAA